MNRLHVDHIVSVGAVEEGDNGPATIMFWKAKPVEAEMFRERPELGAALGKTSDRGATLSASPVARAEAIVKHIDSRLTKQERLLSEIGDMSGMRKDIQAIKGETMAEQGRTPDEILAEVTRRATAIKKSAGPGLSMAEARVEVWKTHPELKHEHRAAQAAELAGADTSTANIDAIVKRYALSISATPENMTKTLSQIRTDLYNTAAGQEIKALRRAVRDGRGQDIRKSAEYADAWQILDTWAGG